MSDALEEQEYKFDCLHELKITFTDTRVRRYVADSYSTNALMVHLYLKQEEGKKLVRIIPYMMIREIEVTPTVIKALLNSKEQ